MSHGYSPSQIDAEIDKLILVLPGMIVADMYQDFPKAAGELVGWIIAGKIGPQKEMVVETKFEDIPKVWEMLFKGENKGKLITKLI